jgi:hypothetical protein
VGRPRVLPGDDSVQASFSLALAEYERLKAQALIEGQSFSQYIRAAVLEKIGRKDNV